MGLMGLRPFVEPGTKLSGAAIPFLDMLAKI